jgi:putative MFS transporter
MDRYGRRAAAGGLLLVGMCVTVVCYRSQSFAVIAATWIVLQTLQGVWPVVYTYTSELFPTRIRAAANGLAHNFLGRWGMVAAPALVGRAAESLGGMGPAVATLALVNLLVIPLLWWVLPETRGTDLSQAGSAAA